MIKPASLKHLSRSSRALYRRIQDDYELGEHHLRLLQLLCEALTRAEKAQALLDEGALMVTDRFGQLKPHPMIAVKRDAEIAASRLLRELDLDNDAVPDVRPPRIQGRYA